MMLKLLSCAAYVLSLPALTLASPALPLSSIPHPVAPLFSRACGVAAPSEALVEAHQAMRAAAATQARTSSSNQPKTVINTYFHVVSSQANKRMVTSAMVTRQYAALQSAYAAAGFWFNLLHVDWTVNDAWAADQNDATMKSVLRRGDYSALNLYFQTDLSFTSAGQSSQLLGYCTLPTNMTYTPCPGCQPLEFPSADYVSDGCNILASSMPGGNLGGYNMGKTAVHEVGHWFGLLHTFQDYTCSLTDPGDYIDDTPEQSTATSGCPVGKNSCTNRPGVDAIHNYMDYSSDACYTGFTPDQITRMQWMYQGLRRGL